MKIETGKYYRNVDGDKVGPMRPWAEMWHYVGSKGVFNIHGKCLYGDDPDLIAEWTDENNGPDTMYNLDLKVGDVVECVKYDGRIWTVGEKYTFLNEGLQSNDGWGYFKNPVHPTFKVISRAADSPKPFGELSPEEKGELLLAHHEGKRVEVSYTGHTWGDVDCTSWSYDVYYRITPKRVAGTVEVDADGKPDFNTWVAS